MPQVVEYNDNKTTDYLFIKDKYIKKSLSPETDATHTYGSASTAKLTEVITNPFW